jgi:O-antigen/teichoic acid export membrane protein
MFAFGKYLLGLFGEGFENQYFILIVFTIGIILGYFWRIFGGISNNIMQVLGNKNLALSLSIFMLVLLIALGLVLIPPFGVEGAIIALIISILFVNIIEVVYLWRAHGVKVI